MCEGPYAKGRLVFEPEWRTPDGKLSLWGTGISAEAVNAWGAPTQYIWRIEVRERKGAPLLRTPAAGTIPLAAPLSTAAKGDA
jgi:hypothetical protein